MKNKNICLVLSIVVCLQILVFKPKIFSASPLHYVTILINNSYAMKLTLSVFCLLLLARQSANGLLFTLVLLTQRTVLKVLIVAGFQFITNKQHFILFDIALTTSIFLFQISKIVDNNFIFVLEVVHVLWLAV